jgi:hypothetical protein
MVPARFAAAFTLTLKCGSRRIDHLDRPGLVQLLLTTQADGPGHREAGSRLGLRIDSKIGAVGVKGPQAGADEIHKLLAGRVVERTHIEDVEWMLVMADPNH